VENKEESQNGIQHSGGSIVQCPGCVKKGGKEVPFLFGEGKEEFGKLGLLIDLGVECLTEGRSHKTKN